jgi:hypothetical protein
MFASELVPNLAAKPSCIFVPLVQIDEIFQLFCKTFVASQRGHLKLMMPHLKWELLWLLHYSWEYHG